MGHRRTTHLRTCRRRAGYSQADVAFLLGCRSASKASRYEHRVRAPNIKDALACEIVFQAPIRDLFPHVYAEIEDAVRDRARELAKRTTGTEPTVQSEHKLRSLMALASGETTFNCHL